MKKILISLGFIALALGANAQVKIKDGTITGSSTTPNSNAILELESNNKGLLYPRVSLTATNAALPGTTMVAGMVVYNTNTVTGTNGVTPGFYYSDGTQWIQLVSSNSLPASTIFIYGVGTPAAAGATCNSGAQNTIYVDTGSASATLGQTWICDGTAWQNYNAPASTAWYLAGSSTDAGANKTTTIARAGSVVIGSTGIAGRVASTTSASTAAQQLASLTVGGDATINGVVIGRGGGQDSRNTALGSLALYNNAANTAASTGVHNTAAGLAALQLNTDGSYNTALGSQALYSNKTGNNNTAVGRIALFTDTTGSGNTAVGFSSLYNSTGLNNTALGYNTGLTLGKGNNNIAIGASVNLPNPDGNYQLNIGGTIWGTGVDSISQTGNIGIDISTPNSTFQVNGSVSGKILVVTGSYTIAPTDYTVVFTGGTIATLPSATGITGRIYRIVNKTGAAMTINANGGSTVSLLSGTTLAAATAATFQASGTTWYQIQ